MIYDVIGFQRVEYDKKDGSGHVSGVNLFIATTIPEDRGQGLAVSREYIKSSLWDDAFSVGQYDIEYSKGFTGNAYISRITKI